MISSFIALTISIAAAQAPYCIDRLPPNDADPSAKPFAVQRSCDGKATLNPVFVRPDGNDASPGTEAEPVQSFAEAAKRASVSGGAIILKGDCGGAGCVYPVLDTVQFRSGPRGPILIKSEGGVARLSGGIAFSQGNGGHWEDASVTNVAGKKVALKKFIFDAGLAQAVRSRRSGDFNQGRFIVSQLFAGDDRQVRSRHPNIPAKSKILSIGDRGSPTLIVKKSLTKPLRANPSLLSDGKTELAYLWDFENPRALVQSARVGKGGLNVTADMDITNIISKSPRPMSAWLENNLAFIDTPGEWYLDEDSEPMSLYYLPGVDVGSTTFTMPLNSNLISIFGNSKGDPVRDLFIDGSDGKLIIEHSNWSYFNHVSLRRSYGFGQSGYGLDGAINGNYLDGLHIQSVTFQNYGNYGLSLGGTRAAIPVAPYEQSLASNIDVFNCEFIHGGAGAVRIDNAENPVTENRIKSSRMSSTGEIFRDAAVILIWHGSGTTVAHNILRDAPAVGISVGTSFRYAQSDLNQIISNDLSSMMTATGDGGAIYIRTPNGIIKGNKISNTAKPRMKGAPKLPKYPYAHPIYLDENAIFWKVTENVISPKGTLHNKSSSNIFQNNGPSKIVVHQATLPGGGKGDALGQNEVQWSTGAGNSQPTWW